MIRCCIFDLDGVVVDTAGYHYRAWAAIACELGFELTPAIGETTRGVSRMASLDIVLRAGGLEHRFSQQHKEDLAQKKNALYIRSISDMSAAEVLPGVADFLHALRARDVHTVLGSSSKNAATILDRCGLYPLFDAVVDGTQVVHAKPDPEVFLMGAERVAVDPCECVVFEDAASGIEAATRAGMRSVGVGNGTALAAATMQLLSFEGFSFDQLCQKIDQLPTL